MTKDHGWKMSADAVVERGIVLIHLIICSLAQVNEYFPLGNVHQQHEKILERQ